MALNGKSALAIALGVVILIADILWLYPSVLGYAGAPAGGSYYRTGYNGTLPNYNATGVAFRGGGSRTLDIAYGVIILVADIIWLYLEFSRPKPQMKKK